MLAWCKKIRLGVILMKKALILSTILAMLFMIASCGNGLIKEEEYQQFYSDATSLKGKKVQLSGRVYDLEKEDKGSVVQILTDSMNGTGNVLVMLYDKELPVKIGDYVKLKGTIHGMHQGKNVYGDEINAPKVIADEFEISSYQDVLSPTKKEVVVKNALVEQNGVNFTVTKVQFAESETRIYVDVTNGTGSKLTIQNKGAKILQNGKEIPFQKNHFAGYGEVPDTLNAGERVSGILTFPKLDQSNFELTISASSEDSNIKFNEFKIEAKIK